jgi:putative Ca2+/H+ antiporter (TMEM165/GDT1 family)
MEWKIFLTTLGTIFLAELGDKTQLAAILMTSKTGHPVIVFGGAVIAFSLVTLIGVVMGQGLVSIVPQRILEKGAALAFIKMSQNTPQLCWGDEWPTLSPFDGGG